MSHLWEVIWSGEEAERDTERSRPRRTEREREGHRGRTEREREGHREESTKENRERERGTQRQGREETRSVSNRQLRAQIAPGCSFISSVSRCHFGQMSESAAATTLRLNRPHAVIPLITMEQQGIRQALFGFTAVRSDNRSTVLNEISNKRLTAEERTADPR